MKKLTTDDPATHSADVVAENVEHLRSLFPEAFTEGKVDFEVLKQLLGGLVDEREEKYGLNWHGKRRARQLALTPSTGTLRPCPEESVDWDTTQNLMIEGDNLEVLKLLQKSYSGKVKLIYIDPPYNTGKDFVYPDDFRDSIQNYLALTGQVDGENGKLSSNTEASGRFHTDWLNMMYPRLKTARNLLREDGACFISVDETEFANLRWLCDEVFGPENFVEAIVWNKRIPKNDKGIGNIHEYILLYVKRPDWAYKFTMPKAGLEEVRALVASCKRKGMPIPEAEAELRKLYEKRGFDRAITLYNCLDADYRIWGKHNVSWPNANTFGPRYAVSHPGTGNDVALPDRGWRWKQETFDELVDFTNIVTRHDGSFICGHIWFAPKDTTQPSLVKYLDEVDTILLRSILSLKSDGGMEVEDLFGEKSVYSYPKPTSLITTLIESFSLDDNDIVLDFFAGSGTTAHATFLTNSGDNVNRRFILVQLPEPDIREGYASLADITKERIRRAADKVRESTPMFAGDLGFRVFKLDRSNIRAWDPNPEDLEAALFDGVEHLHEGRTEQDVLYELLLKLGLDLCVPIEVRTIADNPVHSVGAGTLLVCLSKKIAANEVEALALGMAAWRDEQSPAGDTTVVFRDAAFADDVAKTNMAAILEQHGLATVRSL